MSLLELILPDHAPLDTSESRGEAYLELICIAMDVDGVIRPAELHDALEMIGPLDEFAEYEGDAELAALIGRTIEACRRAGFEDVVRRAAAALPEPEAREAGLRFVAYIMTSRAVISPVENALVAYIAGEFGIARTRFEELLADLDCADDDRAC